MTSLNFVRSSIDSAHKPPAASVPMHKQGWPVAAQTQGGQEEDQGLLGQQNSHDFTVDVSMSLLPGSQRI